MEAFLWRGRNRTSLRSFSGSSRSAWESGWSGLSATSNLRDHVRTCRASCAGSWGP